jgi:hypothetical protein
MVFVIKITFKRWPSTVDAEKLKDALTHVLRLVNLIDADMDFYTEKERGG